VKRLLAALAGLLGIAWWRNRTRPLPALRPDPADELRARLAQARDADDRDEFESGEKPIDEIPDDVETRRRSVHDRARAAADELTPEE
jgi:hypothetical protein